MKHTDFIKSLKSIKNHIIQTQNKPKKIIFRHKENTAKNLCACTDWEGRTKYLYHSQEEIEYILASKEVSLTSYHCSYEKGWHLTKG